jgi:phage terminase large subunit-like protein
MPTQTLAQAKLEKLRHLQELQAELKRLRDVDDGAVARRWEEIARPEQIAPPGDWMTWAILAGRGWGKALCITTPVPTPDGWSRMGDLRPGDVVFDEAGDVCNVTAVFDRTPEKAYRLTFSDGTYIDACDEHQWATWTNRDLKALLSSPYDSHHEFPSDWPTWRRKRFHGNYELPREVIERAFELRKQGFSWRKIDIELGISARGNLSKFEKNGGYKPREAKVYPTSAGPSVRTTQEIVDTLTFGRAERNHSIPVCGQLSLPDIDIPLDPYVLGVWLGDGSKGGPYFCSMDQEIVDNVRNAGMKVHQVGTPKSKALGYTFNFEDGRKVRGVLRKMDVLYNKHVPDVYMRASASQRLALLQGLMDTDGSADGGRCGFGNTNRQISYAVAELARSLGQKPRVYERRATLYEKDCGPVWSVMWRPTIPVFKLTRKLKRVLPFDGPQALRHRHRKIVSAESIDPVPMRCITVDSPNSMFLAGEGMIPTHNTRTAAEWAISKARQYPGARIALVGKTFADTRDTMLEGDSGLLSCISREEFRNHSEDAGYNRTLGEVRLANGSLFKSFSAEKPWRLRGPQHNFAVADECAFWQDAHKGITADTTWSNLVITMRLRKKPDWDDDYRPQIVIATTPRPVALLRTSDPDPSRIGILQRATTVITRGRTMDNIENLSKSYKENVIDPLLGTRLGRQELEAEILDDVPGALWQRDWIEETRVTDPSLVPDLIRVVVAVDPAVTDGESSAQTGIVVAGAARNGRGYVLGDFTLRASPMDAMKEVVRVYNEFHADRVIAEVNQGGDYIGTLLKTVDPNVPYQTVHAKRGKALRAEPVSSLYQQRRISHVLFFPYLEDQMCSWTPMDTESPDRVDALTYSILALKDLIGGSFLSAYGVIRCHKCQNAFTANDPSTKQPRSACPKCSALVEQADED